ncbi:MAG: radical SAM family heme chaperone HemW [Bifidobacteriaceae bacterium]|nr:radical SAM family heme chaperone HemW [Bifidobacteriaceae bacterium]MCI1978629.1 radical SAM family heme chaperone HemW [Bifidobacteriaceae bacterium]
MNAADVQKSEPAKPFEVYLHVPFCLRRCGYCDFNTYTATNLGEGASRANYANLVIQEATRLRRWQEECGLTPRPISTVFFGGGTPTILPAPDLVRILGHLGTLWGFEPHAEVTTEANPDTVDARYIAELADGGFNRISFGMQSAVPEVLRTLDRTHLQRNVIDGVAAAQAQGLRSSVDLIYGAPGETIEQWKTSVEAAIDLGVHHISAYALSVEPTTKMGRLISSGRLASPDDDDEAAKYEVADRLFSKAGFRWYEISNWARDGEVSRHNLGYWRNVEWAGLGPGAHSHFGRMRAWDTKHPRMWAKQLTSGIMPWGGTEEVSASQDLEETVMLGLRLSEGLSVADVERRSGRTIDRDVIRSLMKQGLLETNDAVLIPTLQGRLLNDLVIERVLDALGE